MCVSFQVVLCIFWGNFLWVRMHLSVCSVRMCVNVWGYRSARMLQSTWWSWSSCSSATVTCYSTHTHANKWTLLRLPLGLHSMWVNIPRESIFIECAYRHAQGRANTYTLHALLKTHAWAHILHYTRIIYTHLTIRYLPLATSTSAGHWHLNAWEDSVRSNSRRKIALK